MLNRRAKRILPVNARIASRRTIWEHEVTQFSRPLFDRINSGTGLVERKGLITLAIEADTQQDADWLMASIKSSATHALSAAACLLNNGVPKAEMREMICAEWEAQRAETANASDAVAAALAEQLAQIKAALQRVAHIAHARCERAPSPSDQRTIFAAQVNAFNQFMRILDEFAGNKEACDVEF